MRSTVLAPLLTLTLALALPGFGHQDAAGQVLPGPQRTNWDEQQRHYSAEALQELQELLSEWQSTVARDDASGASRLYLDNAVMHLGAQYPIEGRRAIEVSLRDLLPAIGEVELGVSDFAASGRLAYALGRFWYHEEVPGVGTHTVTGTYVLVAERQNSNWRIRSQVFKPEAPAS